MMWSTSTSTARSLPSFASSTSSSSGAAINRVRNIDEETRQRKIEFRSSQFLRYKKVLEDQGLLIVPVSGDGNCLFRSVSHQIYGTEEHHAIIRQKCLDYMEAESVSSHSSISSGGRELDVMLLLV